MPKYLYTAINQQSKSLNGVIEADSLESAKKKLSSLKLSIVSANEIKSEENEDGNYSKYKFEATDKENKKVIGTISSSNILNAFKKLVTEYELNVIKLASLNSSEQEFQDSQTKVDTLYQEIQKLDSNIKNDSSQVEYEKNKQKENFQKLIDQIIQLIREIQTKYNDKLKPEALEFLQKYEIHLNKIKFSDNIENISNAALKVLTQLQNSNLYLGLSDNPEEEVELQMNALSFINQIKSYQKREDELFSTIQKLLAKVGIKISHNKNQKNNKILSYLTLIFKSKSNQVRKNAFFELIKTIFSDQGQNNKNQNTILFKSDLSVAERSILSITNWLIPILSIFYFISVFASQKISRVEISTLFLIYNTKIIIYAIIATIFLHSAIKLQQIFIQKKIQTSKFSYPLIIILYILIILNL
jgi:hypothetical protein